MNHHRGSCLLVVWCLFAQMRLFRSECVKDSVDYIVVGTGAAGGTLLGRLSEDPQVSVLALEAGGEPNPGFDVPINVDNNLHTNMDWNYTTVPQVCCGMCPERKAYFFSGRSLGGGSSINFMVYTRGNKLDYDSWVKYGGEGWSYKGVLPFFKKLEEYRAPQRRQDVCYHNKKGPVGVEIAEYRTPLAEAFNKAGMELGYPLTDFNAKYQTGFMSPTPANIRNGRRDGTYAAYIKPAMSRKNLRVEANALVTKVIIDPRTKTATGVEYEQGDEKCVVSAKKEVILSAGTLRTPALLMLSGVGPKDHLKKFDIPVIVNSPGVGQNFRDHLIFILSFPVSQDGVTMNPVTTLTADNLETWEKYGTGPYSVPAHIEGVAFVNTKYNKNPKWPDLELVILSDHALRNLAPLLIPQMASVLPKSKSENWISFIELLQHTKSVGSITLNSSDPHDYPIIDPQSLSDQDDVNVLADGVSIVQKIVRSKAFSKYGVTIPEKMSPQCDVNQLGGVNSVEYAECLAKSLTISAFHPVGTARLGKCNDPKAVVDDRLRVHGVKHLRVVDNSIIPHPMTGHPNVPAMMIGEKAAHMIKEDAKKGNEANECRRGV